MKKHILWALLFSFSFSSMLQAAVDTRIVATSFDSMRNFNDAQEEDANQGDADETFGDIDLDTDIANIKQKHLILDFPETRKLGLPTYLDLDKKKTKEKDKKEPALFSGRIDPTGDEYKKKNPNADKPLREDVGYFMDRKKLSDKKDGHKELKAYKEVFSPAHDTKGRTPLKEGETYDDGSLDLDDANEERDSVVKDLQDIVVLA